MMKKYDKVYKILIIIKNYQIDILLFINISNVLYYMSSINISNDLYNNDVMYLFICIEIILLLHQMYCILLFLIIAKIILIMDIFKFKNILHKILRTQIGYILNIDYVL